MASEAVFIEQIITGGHLNNTNAKTVLVEKVRLLWKNLLPICL